MRYTRNIPEVLIPEGDYCYPLFIPAHPDYVSLVVRQLRQLTLDRIYDRDEEHSALVVREQFMERTFKPFMSATFCEEVANNNCFRLYANSAGIQFFANNPYAPAPDIGEDFSQLGIWSTYENEVSKLPDWINSLIDFFGQTDILQNIGYGVGDVFISPPPEVDSITGSLSQFVDFFSDLIAGNFPRVRIDLIGTGDIEIELLSIPSGGSAVVVVDDLFTFGGILNAIINQDTAVLSQVTIAELQRNIIQMPPETLASVQIPISLGGDENTEHNVKIFFMPKFNDEISSPIGLGGGFRRIDVCEGLRVINPDTEEEITIHNFNSQIGIRDNVIMATQEDICEGVMCALTNVMSSAVAGLNSGVSFGIDPTTGEIIIDDGSSTGDLLTGTASELKWGGAIEVYEGLLEYIGDYSDFFTDYPLSEAQAVSFLSQKWLLTADVTQAVSDYYDHRNLSNPHPQLLPTALKGEFFCYGATKQTTASYMIDNVSNDLLLLLSMLSALSQDQYDQWYSIGSDTPRIGYDEAPCYRVPTETIVLNYNDITWNDWNTEPFTGKPSGHVWRVSIKCITEFANANGDVWDGVYFTEAGGNPTLYNVQLFQTYLYPFDYVEPFGGKLPIGGIYSGEQQKATRDPRGVKFHLADKTFTQGQLELTLTDLGVI